MSLLNEAKKEAQIEATVTAADEAPAKKHSTSEYQKKQRELLALNGKIVNDYIKTLKNVPQNVVDAAAWLGREKKTAAGSSALGKPVIYKLFGNTPKVGDKITALKVFEDTGKGFSEMRQLMKKWEKQGITVAFDEASKAYVIKAGDIPAFAE